MRKLIQNNSYIILLFVLVVGLSILMGLKYGSPSDYLTVIVEEGDTIWGYAIEYNVHHKMDHSSFVEWVLKENELQNSLVRAGETLILPIKVTAVAVVDN